MSDVRFLIPVLTGLSKKEVIAVLPKLIKLNPHVVKEVSLCFCLLMFMKGIFFGLMIDMMSEKMQLDLCVYLSCFFRYSTGCGE